MKLRWLTYAVLAICLLVGGRDLAGEGEWEIATPDYAWDFPEDHWARDGYKTEWWYFTGHLAAEAGEQFGYQFTFFRVGLLRDRPDVDSEWGTKDLIMGHAAISRLKGVAGSEGDRHRFSEVVYRAVPMLGGFGTYPDSVVAWSRGPAGTDGKWTLAWNDEAFDFRASDEGLGFGFALKTLPTKPLIFQGPNGYSRKGEGASAASQYYSFTRLATEGTVEIDGKMHNVSGQSWMDKEFFTNSMATGQVGWDWYSLQLDDGREVMIYVLRNAEGEVDYGSGTLVGQDALTTYFDQEGFTVTELGTWTSPSGDEYGAEWRIQIPSASLDMVVKSQLGDQENRSKLIPTLRYWEGAVEVLHSDGGKLGIGFVELTGYGSASMPAM